MDLVNSEFDRYILETSESDKIDAKGPMEWDNGLGSAGLAKDIAAFANSKDGGVIVVGKSEGSNGVFILDGVSEQQASTFETTKVATWINNRFSPPIGLSCHGHTYEGRKFIIIAIDEFSDVPHLCTKSYQDPHNSKNLLLKEKTIYVRTANAESSPLGSIEELRALIGLATAKRRHELLTMFNSILAGSPLLSNKSAEEQFKAEFAIVEDDLSESYSGPFGEGAWMLLVRPCTFNAQLFEDDIQLLEGRVRRNQVRLRIDFPSIGKGSHMRDWGLCNDSHRDLLGLTKAGQIFVIRPYYENGRAFECSWRDLAGQSTEPKLPPGKWMDIKPSLLTIAEFFAFTERFVNEFGVGERIHFEIRATSIKGRHLVTTDTNINRDMTPSCKAHQFSFTREMSVGELQATWRELAAQAMKRFSDIFPDTATSIETMRDWVERFCHRNF